MFFTEVGQKIWENAKEVANTIEKEDLNRIARNIGISLNEINEWVEDLVEELVIENYEYFLTRYVTPSDVIRDLFQFGEATSDFEEQVEAWAKLLTENVLTDAIRERVEELINE